MAEIYRERKRAIFRAYVHELGSVSEAFDVYDVNYGYKEEKCRACGAPVSNYSEWHYTGREDRYCTNGCWSVQVYGLVTHYKTKDFKAKTFWDYYNEADRTTPQEFRKINEGFERAIENERKRLRRVKFKGGKTR